MITLHLDRRELTDGVRTCRITGQMCDILEALRSGKPVAIDRIITRVWPDQEPEWSIGIIGQQMHKLRRRMSSKGMAPLVQNVFGVGYVLTEPLHIEQPDRSVVVNPQIASLIRALAASHPDRVAADRVLAAMVG